MKGDKPQGRALRLIRALAVLSSIAFIASSVVFVAILYRGPREPDRVHIYRAFTEHHAAHYLTDTQYLLVEISRYVFWASMAVMVVAGLILRRFKTRPDGKFAP